MKLMSAIAVASALNIACFIWFAGLTPQLRDGPFVLSKTATDPNVREAISSVLLSYHAAQLREMRLLIAGIVSCFLSSVVFVLCVRALTRKNQPALTQRSSRQS